MNPSSRFLFPLLYYTALPSTHCLYDPLMHTHKRSHTPTFVLKDLSIQ